MYGTYHFQIPSGPSSALAALRMLQSHVSKNDKVPTSQYLTIIYVARPIGRRLRGCNISVQNDS